MELGLEVKVIWKDNDMTEVRIAVHNDKFHGEADIYLGYGTLHELADSIEGFPAKRDDDRTFILGDLNVDGYSGGSSIRLWTKDLAGHLSMCVVLVTGNRRASNQSVILHSNIEAAAIDDFVVALRAMEDEEGNRAFCRFSL